MPEETPLGISDIVMAELVDCIPPEPTRVNVPLPEVPPDSPVQQGFKAEIEQVGAEPPPGSNK